MDNVTQSRYPPFRRKAVCAKRHGYMDVPKQNGDRRYISSGGTEDFCRSNRRLPRSGEAIGESMIA